MDEDPAFLLGRARKCRTLASSIDDRRTRDVLTKLAEDYEAKALECSSRRSERPPDE